MIKKTIRNLMTQHPTFRQLYESTRAIYHRGRKLSYFIKDASQTFRYMQWSHQKNITYWATSAELLFQYHKLEKGLCMPGKKRFFGYDPASATLKMLTKWRKSGLSNTDPIYLGAIETLRAYRARIDETPPERGELLQQALDTELNQAPEIVTNLQTPIPAVSITGDEPIIGLEHLALARRSVRAFTSEHIADDVIQRAIAVAQMSPSACNRQPCSAHIYRDRQRIDTMLELQNGNRGFGHTIPVLLVLTAEASCFFDASERQEPYIDGGLFAMSLILALQAQNVSTCCLNWCVEPAQDDLAHKLGNIPASERIIMYIAVGMAEANALVPRSPRRDIKDILIKH
jgi:nitroreductase